MPDRQAVFATLLRRPMCGRLPRLKRLLRSGRSGAAGCTSGCGEKGVEETFPCCRGVTMAPIANGSIVRLIDSGTEASDIWPNKAAIKAVIESIEE
jgi:hypothetical protein